MEISLIIPTHNRADSLELTLDSAAGQDLDDFEILVVDNASRDTTPDVVRQFQERHPERPIRYVPESKLGLHHARHAGARHAAAPLLVYTDDDATFASGWLRAYRDAFSEHPEMAAAGGPVRPRYAVEPPDWLKALVGDAREFPPLSLMDLGDELRLDGGAFFWGVNMAVRRDVLFELGGFHPESYGPRAWLGDGEAGFYRKLRAAERTVGYVPGAEVYHHIPAERLTLDYLRLRMTKEGPADVYLRFGRSSPSRRRLLAYALDILRRYARPWIGALWRRGRTDPVGLCSQMEAARTWSRFTFALRLLVSARLRRLVARRDWLGA